MNTNEDNVVRNIVKIRNLQGLSKRDVASKMGMNEASYGRIESGKIALSYNHLAQIASVFDMSVIDIITYPDRYYKKDEKDEPIEAVLQIKLKKDKKDQVLKLVFTNTEPSGLLMVVFLISNKPSCMAFCVGWL